LLDHAAIEQLRTFDLPSAMQLHRSFEKRGVPHVNSSSTLELDPSTFAEPRD
jgi:hypothetical protein